MTGDLALTALARQVGLLVDWEDAAGAPKTVTSEDLRTLLAALGYPADTDAAIAESRRRCAAIAAERPALITAEASAVIAAPLSARDGVARLTLEDGRVLDLSVDAVAGGVRLRAPETPGYHRLEIGGQAITLAVAPRRGFTVDDAAPGRKLWGTAVQVYGLRDGPPAPFGDFGALARFAAAAGRAGASALAISPVHALFLADPLRYSPYAPSTRLFLNGLFADPAAVFGDAEAGQPGGDLVDWAQAAPAKREQLRRRFEAFRLRPEATLQADFAAFRRDGGRDLQSHAIFEALHAHFFDRAGAAGWRDWPAAFHDPDGAAVADFAREKGEAVDFHAFVQWLADRSLTAAQASAKRAGMAIGLIADLAVGMDAGGSHAWSRPADVLDGVSVGAPPDLFQPRGQDWGLAAFSPTALKRSGFAPFLATLRAALKHAGGMRIDHAMGLRRLWLTPHGSEARNGAYLTYPFEDLLRLIALESHRARAVMVGEDLGTVPEGLREQMSAAGVMGMRVLWFERDDDGFVPPAQWDADAMAMTATHDLPTVAGWWRGGDLDWRDRLADQPDPARAARDGAERQGERAQLWSACVDAGVAEGPPPASTEPAPAVDAAIGFVGAAACGLALIPMEDLIGSADQVNLPGVVDGHPNWRRRLPASGDDLFARPAVRARADRLNRTRAR